MSPNSTQSLPGPDDVTRVALANGITLLTRSNFNSPSVVVNGYLVSGSLFDPLDKLGLAYFTAQSLMRGTQRRSFQEIYNLLESSGATLGFGASVHNTSFGSRALVEDLPLLFEIISDCLRNPVFPLEQVERLRAQILTGLAIRNQDTGDRAELAFDEIMFDGHPYGRPEDGHPETIQAIQPADLPEFHRSHYGPGGMVIVVVGAISSQQVIETAQQYLGDWVNPSQATPPILPDVKPIDRTHRKHITLPGKTQADLVMGTLAARRNSPDYLSLSLGNNILGQFGMMGRIGDVVREKAGLAYYASTSLNAWMAAGSWDVSAGVNSANLQKAIDLIISELHRFVQEPVTAEELSDSQANYIGRLPISLESNAGVANALLSLERFQLGLDYFRHYADLVRAVTPESILAAARRYLDPEKLVIISAGPALES